MRVRFASASHQHRMVLACCAVAVLLQAAQVDAQADGAAVVPAKVNVVYQVKGETLAELPRQSGEKKTALLITARSKLRMQLSGKTSEFVVEVGSAPTFAVVLPSGETTKLLLFPLEVKGSNREAVVGSGGGLAGESSAGAQTLSLDFAKRESDMYVITPAASLKSGEYAFSFVGSNEFFCFTVR